MIDINCPSCSKRIQAENSNAGKTLQCPACKASVKIPIPQLVPVSPGGTADINSKKPRTGSRPSPTPELPGARDPASQPPAGKKWFRSTAFLYAAALAVLIGSAALLFKRQEDEGARLWENAQKRFAAEVADPEARGVMLSVGRAMHSSAVDVAIPRDLRGRRSFATPDPETYVAALRRLIADRLKGMGTTPPHDPLRLSGFWERCDCESGARYVALLKNDGTYKDAHTSLSDGEYGSPLGVGAGTWRLKEGVLTWRAGQGKEDPNPVVRWSEGGLVLKEMDGRYTYFRRISASKKLSELLR